MGVAACKLVQLGKHQAFNCVFFLLAKIVRKSLGGRCPSEPRARSPSRVGKTREPTRESLRNRSEIIPNGLSEPLKRPARSIFAFGVVRPSVSGRLGNRAKIVPDSTQNRLKIQPKSAPNRSRGPLGPPSGAQRGPQGVPGASRGVPGASRSARNPPERVPGASWERPGACPERPGSVPEVPRIAQDRPEGSRTDF